MNESNKIETLESTRDKMALKCLETSKEEKIILMEKAKAKIQREIKILVNISTFKKDNSQRSALNKWFQDSVKNYFLEVYAAPLIMNELSFTNINQVKEYIHERVAQSEAKFMSLILNYYLEIKRFSKLSTFRSNLEELVLSSLLESYRKADDRYSSYNRQKNIRKQFVGLLLLVFCDCQDNNIPTTSFYDLWNTAYPNDLQYKKKLSRYDLLRGERTLKKKEDNCQQEQSMKSSIIDQPFLEEVAEKKQRVKSTNSNASEYAHDISQELQIDEEKDVLIVKKRKRRARSGILNEQILHAGDPTPYEFHGDTKPNEILYECSLQKEVKQENQEEKDNLFFQKCCLDQIRVSTSCPTNQTTCSTLSLKTKKIKSSPQHESQSQNKISTKQSKNHKKLQIKEAAHWGFIQREEETSPRIPRSTQNNPQNNIKIEESNQLLFAEDSHPRKQMKIFQEQIRTNQNQKIGQDQFHLIQSNTTQSPAQTRADSLSATAYSAPLIENFKQTVVDHNMKLCLLNNPNNHTQSQQAPTCSSDFKNQPLHFKQFLPAQSSQLSASNSQIRDPNIFLPNPSNINNNNEASIHCVRQQFSPSSTALSGCSTQDKQIANSTNYELKFYVSNSTIINPESSSLRTSFPLECANQESNQFSILCQNRRNSIQSHFVASPSPIQQFQKNAGYPISQPEQQKYISILDSPTQFQNLQQTGTIVSSIPNFRYSSPQNFQLISNGEQFQDKIIFANCFPTVSQSETQIFQNTIPSCTNQQRINNNKNTLPLQFGQVIFVPFGNQFIQQNPQLLMSNGYFIQQLPIANENTSLPLISQNLQQQQSLLPQCNYMQIH